MKKKAKVIMLPTAQDSRIFIHDGKLQSCYDEGVAVANDIDWQCQHLYIVSDDEIKEGDWCYYKNSFGGGNIICQAYKHKDDSRMLYDDGSHDRSIGEGITPLEGECKKIIATTDPELTVLKDVGDEFEVRWEEVRIAQPSKAFIEKYCKVGGIEDVLVEYERKSLN